MLREAGPINSYYEYIFDNGLPVATTISLVIGSTGFIFSKLKPRVKAFHMISLVGVLLMFVLMTYYIYNERGGRDYRYISHLVPLVVGISVYTLYTVFSKAYNAGKYAYLMLTLPMVYSLLHFNTDQPRIYQAHTWHPKYKVAYQTIKDRYKPGEAILGLNIMSYYFNPSELAGEEYKKIPRKNQYTVNQLKDDMRKAGSGWVTWPRVKMSHLNRDVINYIYQNGQHLHGYNVDDTDVEVFYFH